MTTSSTEVLGGDKQLVSNIPTASNCDEKVVQASQCLILQGTKQTGEAKSFPEALDGWRFGRDAAPAACCQLPVVRAVVTAVAEAGSCDQLTPEPLGAWVAQARSWLALGSTKL